MTTAIGAAPTTTMTTTATTEVREAQPVWQQQATEITMVTATTTGRALATPMIGTIAATTETAGQLEWQH